MWWLIGYYVLVLIVFGVFVEFYFGGLFSGVWWLDWYVWFGCFDYYDLDLCFECCCD